MSITKSNTRMLEGEDLTLTGDLLVGKTSSGVSNVGAELRDGVGNYAILGTASANAPFISNRTGSDGDQFIFRNDNTAVGYIKHSGTNFIVSGAGSVSGIWMNENGVLPALNASVSDNTEDLGQPDVRWDDVYATNGTIQTSDENEKQDIEVTSEAEQRVAVACKGLLRKFRWKSSVEEKGDDARIHFGIIAQDLQAAFEAEGLDAGSYAMFTSATWTDEDSGEENTRLGVRYSELLAFIISAS